ncbi:nucleoporin NDC1 [Cylas formicarius]|uniref:nucleoporin NDC1 n=1 Tax=Cylas formicarius TaxID=197179 RepID=UPI0029587B53|nr:nucleoporin NDC1 [Cylas formicarius]
MNCNQDVHKFTHKDLLLRKLTYAVTCSVVSQIVILILYIVAVNSNIFHPWEWLMLSGKTLISFSTLIFLIPFLAIIFAQSMICAKDYVIKSSYCSTRFQKFVVTFSMRNWVLLLLHIIVGALLIWLMLSISGGRHQNLIQACNGNRVCLNESSFFLISSGLWTGLYFFIKVYIAEKNLTFPVIQQRKLLQFTSQLRLLLRESILLSFWPALYFSILYYIRGEEFSSGFRHLFNFFPSQEHPAAYIYVELWYFSALYYFTMNLMRFFFNLFLTEPVEFPLLKEQSGSLTLQESIVNFDLPIVQNLACLDLHLLAEFSSTRRQVFFTLSQPGGHPHNWNSLLENILKLIAEYTELLNKAFDVPEMAGIKSPTVPTPMAPSDRFRNLRNMALINSQDYDFISVTKSPVRVAFPEPLIGKIAQKLNSIWSIIKTILRINFLFGELPQANIRRCLANGQIIIWCSQGIADIVSASIAEDRYGIVQKDLPIIITSLVGLKQSLDKLNKVPALARKVAGYDDFNCKMKGAVTAAVKRSLFNICRTFGNYLQDMSLPKDVLQYLQFHIVCKS